VPTWTSAADLIETTAGHAAVLLPDGEVLVAGGSGTDGGPLASAQLYDPATGTWTATGSMTTPRYHPTATLLPNGKVLVVGGDSNQGVLASAELYDPGTRTWTATGSMRGPRQLHTATLLLDGRVLVAGGTTGLGAVVLWSAELYDPGTGTWTTTPRQMRDARFGHTATLLPDGEVLVTGGNHGPYGSGGGASNSAELFDPSTGSWTATGTMLEARTNQTATLLETGKVLVAGGHDGTGLHNAARASAELFDPSTGSWTATGKMLEADAYKTATLLPDGRVLVAGGYESSAGARQSAELYDPRTGTWSAAGNMTTPTDDPSATLLLDGRVLIAGGSITGNRLVAVELFSLVTPASVSSPTGLALPLVSSFTSYEFGYTLRYPAGWTVERATQSGFPGTTAPYCGPACRDELADLPEFWLIVSSTMLAPAQSAESWIEAFADSEFDCQQGPVPMTPIAIGQESGFLLGEGCGWRQIEGPGGGLEVAAVVVGHRGYWFLISGIGNQPAAAGFAGLTMTFEAILSTVTFDPGYV
jgi:hypothetical protein